MVSSTRWRSFMVFGRMPTRALQVWQRLRSYPGRSHTWVHREELRRIATKQAFRSKEGRVVEWIPTTICLRATSHDSLAGIARRIGPAHSCHPSLRSSSSPEQGHDRARTDPPINYSERRLVPLTQSAPINAPDPQIYRWYRRDAPDFWEIISDGFRCWTYDPNSARLWAAMISRSDPLSQTHDSLAERAFSPWNLPVSTAQLLDCAQVRAESSREHTVTRCKRHPSVDGFWVACRQCFLSKTLTLPWSRRVYDRPDRQLSTNSRILSHLLGDGVSHC
jgi:hypothetical protein